MGEKRRRLLALLEREGLDALVLRRTSNVAWYSGGGRTHIVSTPEIGVADVIVTREGDEVVTTVNEARRLETEELGALAARFTVLPWEADREAALPRGGRIGADLPVAGFRDVGAAVAMARRMLTPPEVERYKELGREAAEAMTIACTALDPAQTEFEAAAGLAGGLQERGIDPVVLLVAGESRLRTHRHPLPTAARLGDRVMLVACARRGGLIANLTRLVAFGRRDPAERQAHERLLRVDGAFIGATSPGRVVGDVFAAGTAAYAEFGFDADEWRRHHQGGPTGYEPRDYLAVAASGATVVDRQAFAWNPSVPGLKSEDTILAGPTGPDVLTVDTAWPTVVVEGIARPGVLER